MSHSKEFGNIFSTSAFTAEPNKSAARAKPLKLKVADLDALSICNAKQYLQPRTAPSFE